MPVDGILVRVAAGVGEEIAVAVGCMICVGGMEVAVGDCAVCVGWILVAVG